MSKKADGYIRLIIESSEAHVAYSQLRAQADCSWDVLSQNPCLWAVAIIGRSPADQSDVKETLLQLLFGASAYQPITLANGRLSFEATQLQLSSEEAMVVACQLLGTLLQEFPILENSPFNILDDNECIQQIFLMEVLNSKSYKVCGRLNCIQSPYL